MPELQAIVLGLLLIPTLASLLIGCVMAYAGVDMPDIIIFVAGVIVIGVSLMAGRFLLIQLVPLL
jgi:hypothetical protein